MTRLLSWCRLAIVAASIVGARQASAQSIHLRFQNRDRRYLLHVPAQLPHGALPLVLVFHGGSGTPENAEQGTGFSVLADREHFVVVYPEGIGQGWADGRGTTTADSLGVDDVGFTRAVVADIRKRYDIDTTRVFATGPSNGGIFSNRLGCAAADLFAAIGPVIGTLASRLAATCRPARPISVIGIQSVDDPLIPFGGGFEGGRAHLGKGGQIEGGRATQALWAKLDGCAPEAAVSALSVRVQDGTSVTQRTFSGCARGTAVVWYEIAGGGHRWPPHQLGRVAEAVATRALGRSSQNIDATETIWAFFRDHAR